MHTTFLQTGKNWGDLSPSSSEEGKDEVFLILERNHCGDKRESKTTDKKLKSMNGMMAKEKAF